MGAIWPLGHLAMSEDTFGCHVLGAGGCLHLEVTNTAKYPPAYRTAPQQRKMKPQMSTVSRVRNLMGEGNSLPGDAHTTPSQPSCLCCHIPNHPAPPPQWPWMCFAKHQMVQICKTVSPSRIERLTLFPELSSWKHSHPRINLEEKKM